MVFFGIGFETTAPPNAMTVHQARKLGIRNFSLLVSHVRVPPAIEAIMPSPSCRVQAFLAAGHVCSVMGMGEYPELAERFRVPIVVTGFEPLDILEGVRRTVRQLERGEHTVDNAYAACRPPGGQPGRPGDAGGRLRGHRPRLARHRDDPRQRLAAVASTGSTTPSTASRSTGIQTAESADCRSGEVLQGLIKPHECEAFGTLCTPRTPLGATMVSSEGACAAYYLYRRLDMPDRTADGPGGEPRCLSTADAHRSRAAGHRGRGPARRPLRDQPAVVMGHGGGGALSAELVQHIFAPAFGGEVLAPARATRRCSRSAGPGWPSPPTPSWCGRCSSPAAASATWRSTAPSTTSP